MSFPGIFRRLFANNGAAATLRGDIIPYGTAASTVCQGNDARLTNARPPQAHKATHKTGGADALTPADIGAAAASVSISAGNGLTGGGNLTANRSLAVNFGTAAGTVCQGNDGRLTGAVNSVNALNGSVNLLNTWRKQWIGVPRWWRSTTLPPHHIWADGTLVLFTDWPEFKAVYDAGGFNGMLLEANATAAQISANLGKWKKHPNNLGLYAPQLGGQCFRGWGQGQAADAGRDAGSWQQDALLAHRHIMPLNVFLRNPGIGGGGNNYADYQDPGAFSTKQPIEMNNNSASRTAAEVRTINVAHPCILYLGMPR